jgi:prepilin-type N-terminal cleavage/methylation domain-containing protein
MIFTKGAQMLGKMLGRLLRQPLATKTQRGFGLVEVLIATFVLSILALGITTLVTDMLRMQKKTNATATINQMRSMIIAAVQNGEAWSRTAADADTATGNPEMTCMIVGATEVCRADQGPFGLNLKNPQGGAIFYGRSGTNGFRPN